MQGQGGGAQPPTGQPQYQQASGYQASRFERAINIFTKNLGLVLPMVILFVADIIVGAIVGVILLLVIFRGAFYTTALLPFPFFFGGVIGAAIGFISWFLLGIFLALVMVEARSAVTGVPYSIGMARTEVTSRLGEVLIVSLILGIIGAVFSLVPFVGWLITGLALTYFIAVEALMFTRGMPASTAINNSYQALSELVSQDALTFVIILIAALLSGIPILNFFTVPYAALLLLVYMGDKGGLMPPAPPQTPAAQPYGAPVYQ